MSIIPLFVADRPASLRILSKLDKSHKFGILSHPFTSSNFKEQFSKFECAMRICDSGIYQKDEIGYERLFSEYKRMSANYGIIRDYYRDIKRTIESAELGLKHYKEGGYDNYFKLIGVAQGNSVAEYIQNYTEQREMGFEIVAIGGLLDKMPPEVKIATVRVKGETFIRNVIQAIRQKYPYDKLFPLGIFNKDRIKMFNVNNIWISDYKGWIFRYNIEQSRQKNDRFTQIVGYINNQIFPAVENKGQNVNRDAKTGEARKQKKRLLIMSCGKSKAENPGKAIDVYQGQTFKMVRKYLERNNHLDVKIISAKYGMLDYNDRIWPYDIKMNEINSLTYKEAYSAYFNTLANEYDKIFVIGGWKYRNILPANYIDYCAVGKIGQQLSQLKKWLEKKTIIH